MSYPVISTKSSAPFGRTFMTVWLIFVTIALWNVLTAEEALQGEDLIAVCAFCAAWIVVLVVLVRGPLEVRDGGDRLIVSRGQAREVIELNDVQGVEVSFWFTPRMVSLRLRRESRFGRTIRFYPVRPAFTPTAETPVVRSLRKRIGATQ